MDYSTYRTITARRDGGVLVLTLDRPPMNAVDSVMHAELATIFADVARDPEAGAVVLTGAGRAFSAGGDAAWFQQVQDDPRAFDLVQREARQPATAARSSGPGCSGRRAPRNSS